MECFTCEQLFLLCRRRIYRQHALPSSFRITESRSSYHFCPYARLSRCPYAWPRLFARRLLPCRKNGQNWRPFMLTFDIPQVSSCCLLGRARRAHWMPCGDSRKHFWLTPHTMTSYSSSQLTLAADAPLRALSPPAACGAHPANPPTASAPRPAAAVPRKSLRDSPCVFAFSMIAPSLTIRSASFACVIREYRKAQGRIQRRGATMRNRCSTMRHAVRCDASVRTCARGTGLLGGRIQPARNRMLRSTAVGIPATEPPFVYCHRSKSNCPVGTATSYSANQTGRLPNALLPKRAMSCLFP